MKERIAALRAELEAAKQARRDARVKDDPVAIEIARQREAAVIGKILGRPVTVQ